MRSSAPTDKDAFVCECGDYKRSACIGEPFHAVHKGKRFCVLHYPGQEKARQFNEVLKRRLNARQVYFGGVWFPDPIDFSGGEWGAGSSFESATFNAEVTFHDDAPKYFYDAVFNGDAGFVAVEFTAGADFTRAVFNARADFAEAVFMQASSFKQARFNAEASFGTFAELAEFDEATFSDYVRFSGHRIVKSSFYYPLMRFADVRIEKPDRISFHTVVLRPSSFVNVDARKFQFINVDWSWTTTNLEEETLGVGTSDFPSRYRLLSISCRNLAINAEENHRYEEASRFRYWSMDARRRENWRGFAFWRLEWWYWAASGYGERSLQALLILIGIWVVFALLYMRVGFGDSLTHVDAFFYSLYVMLLQKPDPKPATSSAKALVILETVLGPVQAALFTLAVRRKFIR